ncbi:thiamine diphosphate-binding protein [Mycena filopes]|nr:thiamine diphosphate-binding protein [Mycena filopes]
MLGMHGAAYVNLAMQQVDVNIALGARFDDRVKNDPVLGDVVGSMAALLPHIQHGARAGWFADLDKKKACPITYTPSVAGARIKPQEEHQMWAARHYQWTHPQSMVTSGGLGTMGSGLPPAIGTKVAALHKAVVDLDGDASFRMTAMELATASQYGIGVKVLVLNNEFQGITYSTTPATHTNMTTPDFVALALRCDTAAELPAKMAELLAHDTKKLC